MGSRDSSGADVAVTEARRVLEPAHRRGFVRCNAPAGKQAFGVADHGILVTGLGGAKVPLGAPTGLGGAKTEIPHGVDVALSDSHLQPAFAFGPILAGGIGIENGIAKVAHRGGIARISGLEACGLAQPGAPASRMQCVGA